MNGNMQGFDPNAKEFIIHNARWLCELSALAYLKKEEWLRSLLENLFGLPNIEIINDRGTQLFIAGNTKMIVVSFRGTEIDSTDDWKSDLCCLPEDYADGWGCVHSGFKDAII